MSDETNPNGRPTKYKAEYCQQLIEHMKAGGSFESFASKCDVHWDSLYEWVKVHQDFSEAKKIGMSKLLAYDEQIARVGVTGQLKVQTRVIKTTTTNEVGEPVTKEEYVYSPATFSQTYHIFMMKNRYSKLYRDKMVVEHENIDSGNIERIFNEIMLDPSLAAAAAIIAKKLAQD